MTLFRLVYIVLVSLCILTTGLLSGAKVSGIWELVVHGPEVQALEAVGEGRDAGVDTKPVQDAQGVG